MEEPSLNTESLWRGILVALIRPLARLCLKRSLSVREFTEAAKQAFVEVARQEIRAAGMELSVSRISVMTGVYREEANRIIKRKKDPSSTTRNIISRVMAQWRTDRRYIDKDGEPRILSCRGEKSEFWVLSRTLSKNLNPGTVASEMVRAGYAEKTPEGLKLLRFMQTYIFDPARGFSLLSRDFETLLMAAQENILEQPEIANVHMRTEYDNIVESEVPRIRRWIMDESKDFHRRIREYLAQFDRDINPDLPQGPRAKVVVGGFSHTPPFREPPSDPGETEGEG